MSPETLAMSGGALMSLAFSYVPGLSTWFDALSGTYKRLLLLLSMLLIAAGSYGLACAGWFDIGVTCDQHGIEETFTAFLLATIASQTAYKLTPEK